MGVLIGGTMKKKKSKPIHPQLKLIRDRLQIQEQRDKKYNTFLKLAEKDYGENPNKLDFMFAKIICAYISETPFALKNEHIVNTMIDLMYRGKSYLFNDIFKNSKKSRTQEKNTI
jgi:hypothetical protein